MPARCVSTLSRNVHSLTTFNDRKSAILLIYYKALPCIGYISGGFIIGVKFDTKLSFKDHINYIRNKPSAKLEFLKRTSQQLWDENACELKSKLKIYIS